MDTDVIFIVYSVIIKYNLVSIQFIFLFDNRRHSLDEMMYSDSSVNNTSRKMSPLSKYDQFYLPSVNAYTVRSSVARNWNPREISKIKSEPRIFRKSYRVTRKTDIRSALLVGNAEKIENKGNL